MNKSEGNVMNKLQEEIERNEEEDDLNQGLDLRKQRILKSLRARLKRKTSKVLRQRLKRKTVKESNDRLKHNQS
jgi:hypothetical protein